MDKNKIDKLAKLLKRLDNGENPTNIKKEARDFLSSISPLELSLAEQKPVNAGLAPEDPRHLCSAHLEMVGDEVTQMKNNLNPGHVIHTLVSEHEMILSFLDKLENTNRIIQASTNYDKDEFKKLHHIVEHLVGAEPHHQREEKVLFSRIEQQGVYGPTQVMRAEHEDLRRYKKELEELTGKGEKMGFDKFRKDLDRIGKFIISTLRDHIFKENNILYPTALRVIQEKAVWEQMKKECDKIGYCCFTPKD